MKSTKMKAKTIPVKHGIHIREHKNWNTKTIYNNGHVMRAYRRQPKAIRFQSPMVNDFNQHLCEGWSMTDIADTNEATIDQLLLGRKPLAWMGYQRFKSAGLVTDLQWIITGCEQAGIGKRRELDLDWVRDIDHQCRNAGVAHFFKQRYEAGHITHDGLLDGKIRQAWPR